MSNELEELEINDVILLGPGTKCVILETHSLHGHNCIIIEVAEDNPEWVTVALTKGSHYGRRGQLTVLRAKHLNASYNL